MGLDFDFVKGEGPSIENPVRTAADVDRLRRFEPREALGHVLETIRLLRRELAGRVPLIGFGGAPFTLAAYAIEGGPSTTYARTKAFMYAQPAAWHRLCERFADVMADYLRGAGRSGRAGDADLRLVGGRAGPRRLSRVRDAAHDAHLRRARGTRASRSSISASAPRAILPDMRRAGGDVDRRRLASAARRGVGPVWARTAASRAISIRRCCSARPTACSRRPTTCCAARPDAPGTSSISVTACCRDTPLEHVQALARTSRRTAHRGRGTMATGPGRGLT